MPKPTRKTPRSMCPHCGWCYPSKVGLVPVHPLKNVQGSAECPGSEQYPRNPESDRRPLWNGEPSRAQVQAELDRLGIDVAPAVAKVQAALAKTGGESTPRTHGELVQEVARLTALAADLAVAGQALLDAAKVGERTFWNAAQQWLAVHARYTGGRTHPMNPYV